jgi:hypothetical protein
MNRPETRPVPLRFPLWMRLLSIALVALPILAAWAVWGHEAPVEEWHSAIPYAILGTWLALTYQVFLVEVYYDERGITYISPLAGIVRLSWSEIVAMFYVRGLDGYVIEADDGRRIWFHEWRSGTSDFAAAIQSRLPRQMRGGR